MVRVTTHFLPLLGVVLATEIDTCSVTGTCSERNDPAILLQAHEAETTDKTIHRRVKLVTEIEHMVEKALKLGAPLKTVQVLIQATKKEDPGSWGAKEKKLFDDLIKSIETDMINFLDAEHRSDKSGYEASKTQHELCHTHTSDRFGPNGDIKKAGEEVDQERTKHKACRKMEKAWMIYRSASGAACPVADLGLKKFQEHDKHQDLVTKIESLRTDKQSYATAGGSATACSTDQVELETDYCFWRKSKRIACTAEKQCTDAADLQGRINSINTRITNRKAIYVTLNKVLCRIRHLLQTFDLPAGQDVSDFDKADTCDGLEPADKDTKYDIGMTVPASAKCATDGLVAVRPSTADAGTCATWRNQEFTWDAADYVVPTDCQHSCSDDLPSTFVPDANCKDVDETQCARFQHHQDMCTMDIYKTATFDPKAACCYCGGGTGEPVTASTPLRMVTVAGSGARMYPSGCAPLDTSDAKQLWMLRLCNDPSCSGTGWTIDHNYWTDLTSKVPVVSGAVIAWWGVSDQKVSDCSTPDQCWPQPYPPPGGHWGTPYQIFKLDAAGSKVADGASINRDDVVVFERMTSGQWQSTLVSNCAGGTGSVLGSDWKDFAFSLTW